MMPVKKGKRMGFRRYRIILFALIFFIGAVASGFSQYSVDPNDEIYRYLDLWEGAGLVRQLPLVRPYPEPVLRTILERVVQSGDRDAAAIAYRYLNDLTQPISSSIAVEHESRSDIDGYSGKVGIGAAIQGRLTDTITFTGAMTGYVLDVEQGELLPESERTTYDIIEDNARFGVAGREIETLLEVLSGVSVGTPELNFQAMMGRRSFGPFHEDSVVWSNYAPQTANFVLSFEKERFSYTAALLSARAVSRFKDVETVDDLTNADLITLYDDPVENIAFQVIEDSEEGPGKFIHLQAYTFRPTDRLSLTLFESVVFGPVFQVGYLIPFKFLFQAQGLIGFADNSFLGLSADYRIADRLRLPFIVYVDDANFNDLMTFHFDTKANLALQTGLVWTPLGPVIHQVSVDYTAVTPYMYAHDGPGLYSTEPNYTNYLQGTTSLGSGLEPNSDRIAVALRTQPLPGLSADVKLRFMRHANASEGVLDGYGNDGSVYDDGRTFEFVESATDETVAVYDQGRASYMDELRFLTQEHIQKTWQAGIDLSFPIAVGKGVLTLEGGYLFEYVQDPIEYQWDATTFTGETVTLDDTVDHYVSAGLRYLF